MKPCPEKHREHFRHAQKMRVEELQQFYADAMVLLAACDLAVYQRVLNPRSLIADARLELEQYAGIMDADECMQVLFGQESQTENT